MNHWLAYQLSRDNGFEAKQLSMFTMMLMLMMLMMRQERLPTFFGQRQQWSHCGTTLLGPMKTLMVSLWDPSFGPDENVDGLIVGPLFWAR